MSDSVEAGPFVHDNPIDIEQIHSKAQNQWLPHREICQILQNHKGFHITWAPHNNPPSGSLFLFDRKVQKHFRNDGHNWTKKKDGKTLLEGHQTLKVGSFGDLVCYYAHGEKNRNFQRRSYWMREGNFSHIVFVHYLEVMEKTEDFSSVKETQGTGPYSQGAKDIMPSSRANEETESFNESLSTIPGINLHLTQLDMGKSDNDDELIHHLCTSLDVTLLDDNWESFTCSESREYGSLSSSSRPDTVPRFVNNNVVKRLDFGGHLQIQEKSKASFEDSSSLSKRPMDQKLYSESACDTTSKSMKYGEHDHVLPPDSDDKLNLKGKSIQSSVFQRHLFDCSLMEERLKKLDSFTSKEFGDVTDVNESHMLCCSGALCGIVENDIGIEIGVSSVPSEGQVHTFMPGPSVSQDQLFSIIDFSPNWAYVGSETKVLIVGRLMKGPDVLENGKWSCMFGEVVVPAEVIADGVLRCHTPTHKASRVPFCITRSNGSACSEVQQFEYRTVQIKDINTAENYNSSANDNLESVNGHKGIIGSLADCSFDVHISCINLDRQEDLAGPKAVQKISEISAAPLSLGNASDCQPQKDSLATICDAATEPTVLESQNLLGNQSCSKKFVFRLNLHCGKYRQIIMTRVASLPGIESIAVDIKERKMTVIGQQIDPKDIIEKIRNLKNEGPIAKNIRSSSQTMARSGTSTKDQGARRGQKTEEPDEGKDIREQKIDEPDEDEDKDRRSMSYSGTSENKDKTWSPKRTGRRISLTTVRSGCDKDEEANKRLMRWMTPTSIDEDMSGKSQTRARSGSNKDEDNGWMSTNGDKRWSRTRSEKKSLTTARSGSDKDEDADKMRRMRLTSVNEDMRGRKSQTRARSGSNKDEDENKRRMSNSSTSTDEDKRRRDRTRSGGNSPSTPKRRSDKDENAEKRLMRWMRLTKSQIRARSGSNKDKDENKRRMGNSSMSTDEDKRRRGRTRSEGKSLTTARSGSDKDEDVDKRLMRWMRFKSLTRARSGSNKDEDENKRRMSNSSTSTDEDERGRGRTMSGGRSRTMARSGSDKDEDADKRLMRRMRLTSMDEDMSGRKSQTRARSGSNEDKDEHKSWMRYPSTSKNDNNGCSRSRGKSPRTPRRGSDKDEDADKRSMRWLRLTSMDEDMSERKSQTRARSGSNRDDENKRQMSYQSTSRNKGKRWNRTSSGGNSPRTPRRGSDKDEDVDRRSMRRMRLTSIDKGVSGWRS